MENKNTDFLPSLPLPPEAEDYNNTPFEIISMNSSTEGQILNLYYLCKEGSDLRKEINLLYADFRDTRLEINDGRLYTEEECQAYIDRAREIRERINHERIKKTL